jgi:hypothetical protein
VEKEISHKNPWSGRGEKGDFSSLKVAEMKLVLNNYGGGKKGKWHTFSTHT